MGRQANAWGGQLSGHFAKARAERAALRSTADKKPKAAGSWWEGVPEDEFGTVARAERPRLMNVESAPEPYKAELK